jgi:hypothetical protein
MGRRSVQAGGSGVWRDLRDEELLVPPGDATLTPVDHQLDLLPTDEMSWPSFENLLKRAAREVQGPGASAARRRPAAQRTQGTAQGRRQQRAWSPAIRRASMTCNTGAAKTRWRRLPEPRRAGRT